MVDAAQIDAAAQAIGAGKVVCFPTETTYGLAVDGADRGALARLVALKGRDPSSPFALIAPDAPAAAGLARVWPDAAARLAGEHWPGPLTLVVPARADLPGEIVGPTGGVGVRVSSHPWALALARAVGRPITATSANRAGEPPSTSVAAARDAFGDGVSIYLDAGPSQAVTASTVVDVGADGSVTVLRPGPVVLAEL